mgnify:CR=1 FL=1
MKVQVLSGAIPETFNILFQDVATNITVGGETPTFQRNLFMLLQTLAVTSYLNM